MPAWWPNDIYFLFNSSNSACTGRNVGTMIQKADPIKWSFKSPPGGQISPKSLNHNFEIVTMEGEGEGTEAFAALPPVNRVSVANRSEF